MIRLPTKTEIKALKGLRQPHSLTIYLPYVSSNSSSSDDPNRIQLKNLIKEANNLLQLHKIDKKEIKSILKPAQDLIDGNEFRNNYKRGLALFIRKDFFQYYRLPAEDIKQYVVVGKGFKLKPIVDLQENNYNYYVLHVGYHGAHLFKGDRYQIKKIKFQKKSVDMKQDLGIDELPREIQTHQVAPTIIGKGAERPHGQYNASQVNKNMLIKFFRKIDRRLNSKIRGKSLPLILAGVDYILPIYRQANTYPHLLDQEILGNLENASHDRIRENACEIIEKQRINAE